MMEVMPDWYVILMCGGLATLLGFSVLLCAMILDDRRDAAARVLALAVAVIMRIRCGVRC